MKFTLAALIAVLIIALLIEPGLVGYVLSATYAVPFFTFVAGYEAVALVVVGLVPLLKFLTGEAESEPGNEKKGEA